MSFHTPYHKQLDPTRQAGQVGIDADAPKEQLTIRIVNDGDCDDPLGDDAIAITYRKGSRYQLGNTPVDQDRIQDLIRDIRSGALIGLPVYAYVHSGVSLRASSFQGSLPQGHAEFDSGLSGVAYITKATALEWHGGKIVTKAIRASCLKSLAAIVEEYGRWLNGDCYGFEIVDENGDVVDSCYGFIGYENAVAAAKEESPDAELE